MYHRWFVRLNWITLVFIFLVSVAGSFVRVTGSGMGCPDWPKCFGQWVPPTTDANLPKDYKQIYSDIREKKIMKFAAFLEKIGFQSEAKQLRENKSLLIEQDFNARKTWTEYINRWLGFIAGNGVLLIFAWIVIKYRKRKILALSALNLVLLMIQAWFGSIVVATNLVPWTITVHMLLALVIIALQILLIHKITKKPEGQLQLSTTMKTIVWSSLLITFGQIFLGTQVREYIDALTQQGIGRDQWTELLGAAFFIHRTFSWLVLGILAYLVYLNYKQNGSRLIYASFVILVVELISGVLLAYADMPGLVQNAHLLFACLLFSTLFFTVLKMKRIG